MKSEYTTPAYDARVALMSENPKYIIENAEKGQFKRVQSYIYFREDSTKEWEMTSYLPSDLFKYKIIQDQECELINPTLEDEYTLSGHDARMALMSENPKNIIENQENEQYKRVQSYIYFRVGPTSEWRMTSHLPSDLCKYRILPDEECELINPTLEEVMEHEKIKISYPEKLKNSMNADNKTITRGAGWTLSELAEIDIALKLKAKLVFFKAVE